MGGSIRAISDSHRDIEDLLAERGINVTYEAIRLWCNRFGPKYATRLKRKHRGYGDTFFIDEVFIRIGGIQHYLWRAVDQESLPRERSECFGHGEVVDVYLQKRRDGAAAKRFFKKLLERHQDEPRKIVTDKLRSYGVAHRELIPNTIHDTSQYDNNRPELSHQPTRVRDRGMRRFKQIHQAQRFLNVHVAVYKLFNLGRHLKSAAHYRLFRMCFSVLENCSSVTGQH
jgi:putative transposase